MLFILWDRKDGGQPRRDEDGETIISDGVLGRITADNAYLTIYPSYPDNEKRRPRDLAVGESIPSVSYGLSKGSGIYDIYRVA